MQPNQIRAGKIHHGDNKGSILLVAMLVMLAVTVLGVIGIQSSVTEMTLVRNERDIREAFYLSEGTALEGLQLLVNAKRIDLQDAYPVWHHSRKKLAAGNCDFRDVTQWDADGKGEDNCVQSRFNPESLISAVEWDIASGGSLVMTESRLIVTRVYGLCKKHQADQLIEIGYAMRY